MAEPIRTVVNFKQDCVDPLAKLVLLEAMSFAVEKAESRLESLGKIFPGLENTGGPILQEIKDIRFAIENLNVCTVPAAPVVPGTVPVTPEPPPPSALKNFPKREQDLIKQMPESMQTALALELARKIPAAAKSVPFSALQGPPITEVVKQEKKERTLPTGWGPLEYKGMAYTSPGAFLNQLHGGDVDKIRGKGNYIKQLDADGFNVYIGDKLVPPDVKKEEIEKLKGVGMRVELRKGVIRPTPGGGKPIVKASGKSVESFSQPWTIVQDEVGTMLGVEDSKKVPIPEDIWRSFSSDTLDKLAPNIRKVEPEAKTFGGKIPGLGRSGGQVSRAKGAE
jgi:hypothetical protein